MCEMCNCIMCYCRKLVLVWSALLALNPALAGYVLDKSINASLQKEPATPRFDVIIREIDANVAETVLLPCTVRNIGDKVVSWIRTKDLSILTSGSFTFSTDHRFKSVSSRQADFWGLRISGVKITDTGQYECQVNTDPKMNLAVNLTVTDTRQPAGLSFKYAGEAKIKSPKEVYVRAGSPMSLTCEITPLTSNDPNVNKRTPFSERSRVRWLYEDTELTSESDRGGISVDTDYRDQKITSRLKVSQVSLKDGGLYTCTMDSTKLDAIRLHVSQGEHSEAMQRDATYSKAYKSSSEVLFITLYLLLYIT